MNTDPLLIDAPSSPPALEAARIRLEKLQAEHDQILARAEESGTDGELDWSDEWRRLCHNVERAQFIVTALEYAELCRLEALALDPQPRRTDA